MTKRRRKVLPASLLTLLPIRHETTRSISSPMMLRQSVTANGKFRLVCRDKFGKTEITGSASLSVTIRELESELKKRKTTAEEQEKMKIQVLGPGCMKCNKLYADVEKAITQTGVDAELSKVEKIEEIVKFGAAFTPGLVIDGEIKSQGRVPRLKQIVTWIAEAASE